MCNTWFKCVIKWLFMVFERTDVLTVESLSTHTVVFLFEIKSVGGGDDINIWIFVGGNCLSIDMTIPNTS